MRVIIAGTRRVWSTALIRQAISESGFDISFGIAGGARGIDRAAEDVFVIDGTPHQIYPVTQEEWDTLGNSAGMIRNEKMADHPADALIALPDPDSIGTRGMIDIMNKRGLPVYVKELP